jgi:hypothetical protein
VAAPVGETVELQLETMAVVVAALVTQELTQQELALLMKALMVELQAHHQLVAAVVQVL